MFRLLSYHLDERTVSVSGSLGRLIVSLSAPVVPGRDVWTAEQHADALVYELATLLAGRTSP